MMAVTFNDWWYFYVIVVTLISYKQCPFETTNIKTHSLNDRINLLPQKRSFVNGERKNARLNKYHEERSFFLGWFLQAITYSGELIDGGHKIKPREFHCASSIR